MKETKEKFIEILKEWKNNWTLFSSENTKIGNKGENLNEKNS